MELLTAGVLFTVGQVGDQLVDLVELVELAFADSFAGIEPVELGFAVGVEDGNPVLKAVFPDDLLGDDVAVDEVALDPVLLAA